MFNASVIKPLAFALLVAAAVPAHADWYLDNESSRLSFVTTKNTEIAEVQRFLVLHGKVDGKGAAQLEVELESVNSGIPLRDERMRNQLFEIKTFPDALINAQINLQMREFLHSVVGRTLPVLIEKPGRMPGQIGGRTPYLQAVHMDGPERLIGQIVMVEIVEARNNSLIGKIVTDVERNPASVLESQAIAAQI